MPSSTYSVARAPPSGSSRTMVLRGSGRCASASGEGSELAAPHARLLPDSTSSSDGGLATEDCST